LLGDGSVATLGTEFQETNGLSVCLGRLVDDQRFGSGVSYPVNKLAVGMCGTTPS
jgi:hypothetical protein